MRWKAFKYALPLSLYFLAWRSFTHTGFIVWLPVMFAFAIIPLLELIVSPDIRNIDAAEEEMAKKDRVYDWLLYLVVPLQYGMLYLFLNSMADTHLSTVDRVGRIMAMGLLCGVMGINTAHELGHRVNRVEQLLARSLLLTSLYMHFFIEHNRGHHKHVGTPADPSTARLNESLYIFWFRSITGVYRKAWTIATAEQLKKGRRFYRNEMLLYQLVQAAFCVLIGILYGGIVLFCFLCAALMGILLLETVNYIEHYGLMRRYLGDGRYERAMPEHSWNSSHPIGRLMLFELSRHSDHHYLASRKYQVLRHHDNTPQLPTGYPGSMLLAMVPPLWYAVMNRRISAMKKALP